MEDQLFFVHTYLTTFAPESVAIGLNALVYVVIKQSEKLQHSALLRKDVSLSVAVSGLITIFFQIIVNFARNYLIFHDVACTGMAYFSQVSIGVMRCAILVAAYHRYSGVVGARSVLGDYTKKDLTLFVWIAPAILESPTLLSFGIDGGICGFLHAHLAMIYIGVLAVMAVAPIFIYVVILQLTLSAMPENVPLGEEQLVLKRSTKIVRGILIGGIVVFLPAQLWNVVIDELAICFTTCFFVSHVLLIVICVAEVICFAFMDPVFQLEYRLQKNLPEF